MDTSQFKDVQVNGRTFRIRKFTAKVGSYMIVKMLGVLSPAFNSVRGALKDGKVAIEKLDFTKTLSGLSELSEEDFGKIQSRCLEVCFELLGAGETPVVDISGNFTVTGLEYDTMAVMALTVHAVMHNMSGFLAGSPLAGLMGPMLASLQQEQKT